MLSSVLVSGFRRLAVTHAQAARATPPSSTLVLPAAQMISSPVLPPHHQHQQQQQIRHRSNRSRRGLYNGKDIRSGNNVPFSMKKTKRKFKPNVFKKSVYSETLDEMVRFHLTASTLRSIDKAGGLDNYLLTSRYVTSGEGLACKERILKKKAIDAHMKKKKKKKKVGVAAENATVDGAEREGAKTISASKGA